MLEPFTYLAFLLAAIGGLAVCDWRWQLAIWHDARRSTTVLVVGITLFVVWDILGIALGIFFPGNSRFTLGVEIVPGFHIEELLFLVLLCYTALTIWRGSERWQRI